MSDTVGPTSSADLKTCVRAACASAGMRAPVVSGARQLNSDVVIGCSSAFLFEKEMLNTEQGSGLDAIFKDKL